MTIDNCLKHRLIPEAVLNKIKKDRRWLHAHPELAFKEIQTSKYICNRLNELDIPFVKGKGFDIEFFILKKEICSKQPYSHIYIFHRRYRIKKFSNTAFQPY